MHKLSGYYEVCFCDCDFPRFAAIVCSMADDHIYEMLLAWNLKLLVLLYKLYIPFFLKCFKYLLFVTMFTEHCTKVHYYLNVTNYNS